MRSTNEAKCFSKAPSGAFFVPCGHLPGLWPGVVGAGDIVPVRGRWAGSALWASQGAMRPRRGRLFRQPPTAGAACPRADDRVGNCERVAMAQSQSAGVRSRPRLRAVWRRDIVPRSGHRGMPRGAALRIPAPAIRGRVPATVCRPSGLIGCRMDGTLSQMRMAVSSGCPPM